MHIKSLFLIICCLQLHAATHNSDSLPMESSPVSELEQTSRSLAQPSLNQPSDDQKHTTGSPAVLALLERIKNYSEQAQHLDSVLQKELQEISDLSKKIPTITDPNNVISAHIEMLHRQACCITTQRNILDTRSTIKFAYSQLAEIAGGR